MAGALAAGAEATAITGVLPSRAASISPLVTRPSLPVPATEPGAMPPSAISLAAAGMATPALDCDAAAAAGAAATGAAATAAGAAAAGAVAPATAAVSIRAISCSAATVAPSPCKISTSTPLEGAGHSSTTLSVSISIRVSSAVTASPTFFFHCSRVASATDSESCGTLTSTIAMCLLP